MGENTYDIDDVNPKFNESWKCHENDSDNLAFLNGLDFVELYQYTINPEIISTIPNTAWCRYMDFWSILPQVKFNFFVFSVYVSTDAILCTIPLDKSSGPLGIIFGNTPFDISFKEGYAM